MNITYFHILPDDNNDHVSHSERIQECAIEGPPVNAGTRPKQVPRKAERTIIANSRRAKLVQSGLQSTCREARSRQSDVFTGFIVIAAILYLILFTRQRTRRVTGDPRPSG